MIAITGSIFDTGALMSEYHPRGIERKIISILSSSIKTYAYNSLHQLKFEIDLRRNIVMAARQLNRSYFSFEVFRDSRCNTDYWRRTDEGGFLLKEGAIPLEAVKDIYRNSQKYATECATAMVIVYYRAAADIFPEERFNQLFSNIYLMNWQHLDSDFGIRYYRNETDYVPGDCRYFKNPDVDPLTPEWQGENVIDMGDGSFYGHGLGIQSAGRMIRALNRYRKEGAEKSAYLMDSATRPDFILMADKSGSPYATRQEDYSSAAYG